MGPLGRSALLRCLAAFLLLGAGIASAGKAGDVLTPPAPARQGKTVVYLFWGNGCPHCAQEEAFLKELRERYPAMEVRAYEVWKNTKNAEFFHAVMQSAGARDIGVPATIIGDQLFFGFNERTARVIEGAIADCVEHGCPDTDLAVSGLAGGPPRMEKGMTVPLLGEVDPATVSLPLFTVVIGGLDSFNPCAFFVLLFLLSLLIHARSRGRMLFIGGIFVLFSGTIYFLFMAAWLNIFLVIGQLRIITLAAGIIAVTIAAVNIKDYFLFGKGVSLSIPESAKPRLFERMRGLVRAQSLPALIAGTVVLAVMANFYELLCTAGFPMVYTRVLTLHRLPAAQYYLYLALYNMVYVLPLAAIVAFITVTLGSRKLTERQGRRLKLLSGLMMLFLGILLLVRPGLLNNALAALALLAASLGLTALIAVLSGKIRPETAGR